MLFGVLGAGGIALALMAAALIFGAPSAGPAVIDSPSPAAPAASPESEATTGTTPGPTVLPTDASPAAGPILIRYQLQEGERLVRVAEKWGISRADIVRANPDGNPREARAGDEIVVPVPVDASCVGQCFEERLEEIEATEGFVGYAAE